MSTPSKKIPAAMSMADLDQQFNPQVLMPERIKAALARLGEHAMTSNNFSRESRVPTAKLAQYAEDFREHIVIIRENGKDRTLWCGTAAFAKLVKERLGI